MSDWRITRKGTSCAECKRIFAPGEPFVSAIFTVRDESGGRPEDLTSFRRVDTCSECFLKLPEEPFSRWVTRIPPKTGKKPPLDLGLAREFLLRLVREQDPAREKVALVLTLLLLRKRRVRLEGERWEGDRKVMDLSIPAEGGAVDVSLSAPELGPEEAVEITAELNRLFGLGDAPQEE